MSAVNQHVFSHGIRDTRETLEVWSRHPRRVLGSWIALSLSKHEVQDLPAVDIHHPNW